ncbi:putative mitochondrial adenine nucleotide transporter BTL1-like [Hibiscus syriacus]|uniref:Mitochondrial adenine nucleotide transporter BTL1-like n=1 Tax=Hibiscus syriacus TaxID=106335 RepID=A0A6A2X602_HIBSY|nr:auxin-responsive protein SAUR72-like [Hibiscus syriacus]KAE8670502.1 putative mitochondrial adenine nucleotide transporter BTL1-like [Hibiscus syriacus]
MDSSRRKSNQIREVVRLQQILKKWKKLANASNDNNNGARSSGDGGSGSRSIKFLKRTLSFTEVSPSSSTLKGFVAVTVGEERKRFVIPTEYLGYEAFRVLLRKAEEEFGFQQEGVLSIPCEVSVFEKILKMVEIKKDVVFLHDFGFTTLDASSSSSCCASPDAAELPSPPHHPQMYR